MDTWLKPYYLPVTFGLGLVTVGLRIAESNFNVDDEVRFVRTRSCSAAAAVWAHVMRRRQPPNDATRDLSRRYTMSSGTARMF